ncbi:MAG: M48 family metalloprotease, partial [Rickettsiales bacterium]|nr:M48 family metalloprotease [Rickettsiales bacterium]
QRLKCAVLVAVSAVCLSGCNSNQFNMDGITGGALTMFQGATLSDEQLNKLSADSAHQSDTENELAAAGSPYDQRLQHIARYINIPNRPLTFKVYLTDQVNAFALPNGEVRVFSGLMDKMNDQELLFILGHEAGHVVHKHAHKEMQLAYAASGARQIAASNMGQVGQLAASELGELTEAFVNAQFSQSQEEQSDDYGAALLRTYRLDPKVGATALRKLASGRSDIISQMFSSHPDPEDRAKRIELAGKA